VLSEVGVGAKIDRGPLELTVARPAGVGAH
jgi:hypothetical protein